jgi:hypothetical protein
MLVKRRRRRRLVLLRPRHVTTVLWVRSGRARGISRVARAVRDCRHVDHPAVMAMGIFFIPFPFVF